MRILVRDVSDNTLGLYKMDDAIIKDSIECESATYSVESAINFSDEFDNHIFIVLPEKICESILYSLLRDGYADLSMYGNSTYIFPSQEETVRLRDKYDVIHIE